MASKLNTAKLMKTGHRAAVTGENNAEFLKGVTNLYQKDLTAEEHNMDPAREDMKFVLGDQWNEQAKQRRQQQDKPVITVNRLPAFVAQYIGSRIQTDTTIKLSPARGGTKKIAEIRQGLLRTIMRTNQAKLALNQASMTQYICGVGNFLVEIVDAENDVFLRDIQLRKLDDPHQVIWDRASNDPTGADANHCFVFDYMTKDDFNDAYPEYEGDSGWYTDEANASIMTGYGWEVDEMVRVCQFWQMKHEDVTLGLEAGTGDVIDVTDWTEEEMMTQLELDDDGAPIYRETTRPYAECHVMTASNVLEGPYRLDISRLPVFRAEGWTLTEASVRHRWGFVRNAKDPQRIHNFWRSIMAEELMKSPASKWLLDSTSDQNGQAEKFRQAHRSGDPVLTWDSQSGGAKPEFIPPPQINQAVLTEAEMTVRDIKDVTNRHEASMGQAGGEVSGKAINARQRVSELGDVIYSDNMNMAMSEAGKVINELIPAVFDTHRTVKITGEDDQETFQLINGDFGDETPDVTKGKYDITYSTGPSYATKRQESVDILMTLMNTMPQTGNLIADIIVRNMDIPGSEEIEERLSSILPPGMLDMEKLSEKRRARVEAQQKAAAEQQNQSMQMQMAQFQATIEKMGAEIFEIRSRGAKNQAQAAVAASEVGMAAAEIDVKQDKNQIDAAKVGLGIDAQGLDMFKVGLAQAAAVEAQNQESQNVDTQGSNEGGEGETQ